MWNLFWLTHIAEAVQRCSVKNVFLQVSQNSQESTWVSFLIKLQPKACNIIKKDSGAGVFLWILQNFWEHIFYRTPPVSDSYIDFVSILVLLNWTTPSKVTRLSLEIGLLLVLDGTKCLGTESIAGCLLPWVSHSLIFCSVCFCCCYILFPVGSCWFRNLKFLNRFKQ